MVFDYFQINDLVKVNINYAKYVGNSNAENDLPLSDKSSIFFLKKAKVNSIFVITNSSKTYQDFYLKNISTNEIYRAKWYLLEKINSNLRTFI